MTRENRTPSERQASEASAEVRALVDRALRLLDELDAASRGVADGATTGGDDDAGERVSLGVAARQPIVDELASIGARLGAALSRLRAGAPGASDAETDRRLDELRRRVAARTAADAAIIDALRAGAEAVARSMAGLHTGKRAVGVYAGAAAREPSARFQDRSA